MKYKISVILPVFNVENYIRDALESILEQSIGFENLEIIMINDCSTDKSGTIIDEYANKYENFIAIHLSENSGGAGKPRNIGIEKAHGDYLMFLDPDDYYAHDACEVLYEKITHENVDIVFGTFALQGETKKKCVSTEIKADTINDHKRFLKGSPTLWTKIFKRSFIKENEIKFPEIVAAQDSVFVVNAFLKAKGIIFINKIIVYYNSSRDGSVTNKNNIKTLTARMESYNLIHGLCKDNDKEDFFIPLILKDKLINWMKHFLLSDLSTYEKKKILKLNWDFFNQYKEHGLTIPPQLVYVFECIVNKEFDDAIFYLMKMENQINQKEKMLKPREIQFNQDQLNFSRRLIQEKGIIEIIKEIETQLSRREKKLKEWNMEINYLCASFYEMGYYEGRGRSLIQRFVSKFPSSYILFFKRNRGIRNAFINLKGYKAIKTNKLFNVGFYLKNYEDVQLSGMDPIIHYIYYGFKEGRKPNSSFDGFSYLEKNIDVKKSNMNPLIHYALYGIKEGRKNCNHQKNIGKKSNRKIGDHSLSMFSSSEIDNYGKTFKSSHHSDKLGKISNSNQNKRRKISIKVPAPFLEVAPNWGDYHFALALKKEFDRNNFETKLHMYSEWEEKDDADVVLVLRGKFEYKPKSQNFNIMWNISHPDLVSVEEYNKYDYVFIASEIWAKDLKSKLKPPVESLLQCTDSELFYPDYSEEYQHDLLFVGNSRKVLRKILKDLLPTQHDLAVYGKGWEQLIDKKYLKGEYIPNSQLRKAYSSCKILLNDHWDDMRDKGFLSNRLFDGFAAGAFIISDEINGTKEIFGDSLIKYNNPDELRELLDYYLYNEEERERLANNSRNIVLNNHTFEKRVKKILEIIP